ncbi:TSUP family transporter [Flavobacterium agricola]|uniref:Probable membrane transporter protein n=1 Tax=Flavobacterium agricola TaxID=2870839 RepID=A0ABY6LWV1_9FLAO|nr:TSUP family transporter [Flavobacterium agricola]UYW00437.1 TSUP family transporter [Flavobacterium agricola]
METYVLILLCLAAFVAGFVDAIVGGGGLIQTPLAILLLPQYAISTVIGSLKIPAFSGTFIATLQYLKKVKVYLKLFILMAVLAFVAAYFGSHLLTVIPNDFMKPVLFVVLVFLAIYTFLKKDFGQVSARQVSTKKQFIYGSIIALVVGFYDGFIGPGTGSFFILGFIVLLGFDFLTASTHAKLVNLVTNLGSICLFLLKGKIVWAVALPMAASNALGGFLGARLAIKKGNGFIRYFFLFVVCLTLLRFGYEVFTE